MKKISTLFITIIFLLTTNLVVSAQPTDAVNINPMYSYILIDAKSGQVLLENKADDKLRPASTTKIMTAIVAIENGKLDKVMNVSKEAVNDIGVGGMNIGIQEGESNLTLENLLNVMLIKSANETANIISENVFPTKQEFIDKMNAKAKALGATNTYYVNPCGKDDTKTDQEQLTTARDLSTIARYGMTIPEFRQIVSKEYYKDLPATNRHKTWPPLRTTNQLLWNNPKYTYNINGTDHTYTVEGIKTGFTSGAGHNLVTAAFNEDGMELIAVVMHVSGSTNKIFEYTKNLYKYGFEHYDNKKLISKNEKEGSVVVSDANKNNANLDLVAKEDFSTVLPLDKNSSNVDVEKHINDNIKAPVKEGQVLGYIKYSFKGTILGQVDLVASHAVEKSGGGITLSKNGKIGSLPYGIIIKIAGVLIVLFMIRQVLVARRRKKRRKQHKRYKQKQRRIGM